VFISSLFNDASSETQDYIAPNEMMICEWRIGKNVEGRGCGLMSGTVPVFFWRD
jgi:hypothetical protein